MFMSRRRHVTERCVELVAVWSSVVNQRRCEQIARLPDRRRSATSRAIEPISWKTSERVERVMSCQA